VESPAVSEVAATAGVAAAAVRRSPQASAVITVVRFIGVVLGVVVGRFSWRRRELVPSLGR
jgi:hypothetical protein